MTRRRDWTADAVQDADGRLIVAPVRVTVIAGDYAGRTGRVVVTRPATGESVWEIPAGVGINFDDERGGGLHCNASMVRIAG